MNRLAQVNPAIVFVLADKGQIKFSNWLVWHFLSSKNLDLARSPSHTRKVRSSKIMLSKKEAHQKQLILASRIARLKQTREVAKKLSDANRMQYKQQEEQEYARILKLAFERWLAQKHEYEKEVLAFLKTWESELFGKAQREAQQLELEKQKHLQHLVSNLLQSQKMDFKRSGVASRFVNRQSLYS